jgi:hypothetical protein
MKRRHSTVSSHRIIIDSLIPLRRRHITGTRTRLDLGSMRASKLPATLALALILDPASARERQREHVREFRSAVDDAASLLRFKAGRAG